MPQAWTRVCARPGPVLAVSSLGPPPSLSPPLRTVPVKQHCRTCPIQRFTVSTGSPVPGAGGAQRMAAITADTARVLGRGLPGRARVGAGRLACCRGARCSGYGLTWHRPDVTPHHGRPHGEAAFNVTLSGIITRQITDNRDGKSKVGTITGPQGPGEKHRIGGERDNAQGPPPGDQLCSQAPAKAICHRGAGGRRTSALPAPRGGGTMSYTTSRRAQETVPGADGCEEQRWGKAAFSNSQTNLWDKGSEGAVSPKDNGGHSRPVLGVCDPLGNARATCRIRNVPH